MLLKILLTLFILLSSVAGSAGFPTFVPIKKNEAGIGRWQEMPFGEMRILSCSSGVKDLSMVVGGLQVKLNPDWIMKKPTLKPLNDNYPSWIETPVAVGNGQNPTYQGEILFPLIYGRSSLDKTPFELGVQGDLPVCQGQKCMTLPIRMTITLSPEEANYTTACFYLMDRQRLAPLPADAVGIKGVAWKVGDAVQMAFSGLKKVNVAFLKTATDKDFQVQETQIEKTGAILRVKAQPWALGTEQDWILITDKGIFKVPVKMQQESVVLPPAPPSKIIWFLGWELFFLTPLFIWWGLGCARTNKIWKKEIIHFVMLMPLTFVLKGLLNLYCPLDFVWYAIGILGLVCLFPPARKASALGVFLLWPYFPEIPELTTGALALWILVMLIEMIGPFVLLYVKADEIGKVLRNLKKAHFFTFNLIFLIPTVWLLISSIGYVIQGPVVFSDVLNPNGLSVVAPQKEQSKWVKEANLIDPDSSLGISLQKMYQRSTALIWQDDKGRLILSPDISPKKAREVISNWQNYHAVNTP